MSQEVAEIRAGQTTRGRILQAAILRFSQHSYEQTRLRDIAADVGVDVAFVHRSFGSKELLFAAAVRAAFHPEALLGVARADLADHLARRVLEPSLDHATRLVDPLDIVIRSLSSPQAIPILRAFILRDFVEPLAGKLDDAMPQRAALITACLAGISLFRNVLLLESLMDDANADLQAMIARLIDLATTELRLHPISAVADESSIP